MAKDKTSPNKLLAALRSRYPRAPTEAAEVEADDLQDLLAELQIAEKTRDSLQERLTKLGAELSNDDYAMVAFLDECWDRLFKQYQFHPDLGGKLYSGYVGLVRVALTEGFEALTRDHPIFGVLDQLIELAIGWHERMGQPGARVQGLMKQTVRSVAVLGDARVHHKRIRKRRDDLLLEMASQVRSFLADERERSGRTEERLLAAETGLLVTNRARNLAADLLNRLMAKKQLPPPFIAFLQSSWFETLQRILIQKGIKSEEWTRATKLTETLLWTMTFEAPVTTGRQPRKEMPAPEKEAESEETEDGALEFGGPQEEPAAADAADAELPSDEEAPPPPAGDRLQEEYSEEQQKFFRIVEELPNEVRELSEAIQGDSESAAHIEAIEAALVTIMSGADLEKSDHTPLPCDESVLGEEAVISQVLLAQVDKVAVGQWCVYEEQDRPPIHIKLVLKMAELYQLLFVDRNGVKALQVSYDDFAYFLSSGIATPLPSGNHLTLGFKAALRSLLAAERQERKATRARSRRIARIKAMAEASARSVEIEDDGEAKAHGIHDALEIAQSENNQQKLAEASKLVDGFGIGTWVEFSIGNQDPQQGKLAVRIPRSDEFIFVDRQGVKVAAVKGAQLTALLVSQQCRVISAEVNEPDPLLRVVNEFRKKRQ